MAEGTFHRDEPSQLTITLERPMRELVERVAKQEDRTVSAQVRYWLGKAIAAEQARATDGCVG
jgi:hypothetical protein